MTSQNIVNSLDKILTWIMRLVLVNVLWVLYTMLGLIVGGIFPATIAALKIFRKWTMGDLDVSIRKTFKQEYREEFINANIVGWILTIAGAVLYTNYLAIKSMGDINIIFSVAFYLLILFYVNLVIWSFPQLAHYNGNIAHFFRNAIIIGFGQLHYTIAIGMYLFIVLYFSLKFPGLLPFFTISIAAYGWIRLSMNLFQKNDQKMTKPLLVEG
ncbi:YesL family protein [Jeotgalibacillus proteolyticus]|uniref:DUF624 domain-containing protein n=1 Tax=Jeotgalibacillus proteolyticus TaxID=2082395 RepID=A0A2S5GA80_9BACL|nr:DUF624 domain-containing protein [Jeotgalibacillus proteolyticus]PPA69908.1 hypothetical protein C4B60_15400 [Jeotgalibacillus proteolyticus]